MPEADDQNFYAFRSEDDFNRAARATRFTEGMMHGPLESKEFTRRLKSSTEVTVEVNADADEDGYYGGKFVYYDDVETLSWEAIDDDDTCLVFGLNNEELTFTPATKYFGRVVGRTEDATPIVAVTVGGAVDGGGGDSTAIGVLDGALAEGSFATMSVWAHNVGGSLVDSGTNITVYERDTGPLPAGASVAAIRGAPGSTYFVVGEPASTLRGKLDGSLSYQGSATMSVWTWNGSAEVDATDNVTVYDWHLSSGQSIPAGTQVSASYDRRSGRYYVGSSQWCT